MVGETPYEVSSSKVFNLKSVRDAFGSEIWAYVPKEKWPKLDVKSTQGIFVDYAEKVTLKDYRVYFPNAKKMVIQKEIIFTPETQEYNKVCI